MDWWSFILGALISAVAWLFLFIKQWEIYLQRVLEKSAQVAEHVEGQLYRQMEEMNRRHEQELAMYAVKLRSAKAADEECRSLLIQYKKMLEK